MKSSTAESLVSVADSLLDLLEASSLWEIADSQPGNAFAVAFVIADTLTRLIEATGNKGILEKSSVRIVHGRPTLRREPFTQFDHAWVELAIKVPNKEEDKEAAPEIIAGCIDFSNGIRAVAPMADYYTVGAINEHELSKYTVDAYKKAAMTAGHTGPFESKTGKPSKPN